MKIYQKIATCLQAMENCEKSGNNEWFVRHGETINNLVREHLPSGGGWDRGTIIDYGKSTPEKLVFFGSFHHMDEHGGYTAWTDHIITVKASLAFEIEIKISGHDRNGIKEMLHQMFNDSLTMSLIGCVARTVIHTACKHCDQDIEGIAPFNYGEWRDRGNNRHCPTKQGDAGQLHEPTVQQ